jgi:serine/threonine-protein kinase
MGVVYLADTRSSARSGDEGIHPELSKNSDVVSRFVTEAKAVNQIGHEHIVDIADFGTRPKASSTS